MSVRKGDAERKSSPKGRVPEGRFEYLSEVTDKDNKRVSEL